MELGYKKKEREPWDVVVARSKYYVQEMKRNDDYAYDFLSKNSDKCNQRCGEMIKKLLKDESVSLKDYNDFVSKLYIHLWKPGKDGRLWHKLEVFDYKTSVFAWIKRIAYNLLHGKSGPVTVNFPVELVETGLAEDMVLKMPEEKHRRLVWFLYIEKKEEEEVMDKLGLTECEFDEMNENSVKSLKYAIKKYYSEYYGVIFAKKKKLETISIDEGGKDLIGPNGDEEYEKLERKIKLVESIASLDDRELKFIVMRKLKGFRSKEIASELVYKRNKKGEVRFDEKGEKLKADAAYVDTRFSEAKIQLKAKLILKGINY